MARKRISGTERKGLIIAAAREVFARAGYEAAKTLEIARAAKVSEALVYRHFPSKEALYRAVLRQTIREQDENLAALRMQAPSTAGLIATLTTYFRVAAGLEQEQINYRFRLMLGSLAGDGNYASLIYRRSQRMLTESVGEALANAREAGDLLGQELSTATTSMFIEHIGTMMSALHALPNSPPYGEAGEALVRQAVWFCCRGIGFTDEAIARHIDR